MDTAVIKIVDEEIIPLIEQGKISLFVGAGFSIGVPTIGGTDVPSSDHVKERILNRLGYSKEEIEKTELGDAFAIGQDDDPEFEKFLKDNFTVTNPHDWQIGILRHWWRRVYTTNIDDCLNKGFSIVGQRYGEDAPAHNFFNFNDRSPVETNPTEIPLVSLHGSIDRISDGFIFDGIAYADASVRQSDWLRDAALHISFGHCILLGSKFKEPDIDTALRQRKLWDQSSDSSNPNWIVLRNVDRAKSESYSKRNIVPLRCEIDEFCKYLNAKLKIITAGRFLRRYAPHIGLGNRLAGGWFVKSFDYVTDQLAKSKNKTGVLSRFFSGDAPNWYYLENDVPAKFEAVNQILNSIKSFEKTDARVQLISVIGGVATGKTTLCMLALTEISKFNNAVYFFDPVDGIDVNLLWDALKDAKGVIVLCFDRSSEYFYAINQIALRLQQRDVGVKVAFLVEERVHEYNRNLRHLSDIDNKFRHTIDMREISQNDGKELYRKLKVHGMATGPLEGLEESKAVELILDKDRGFRGDLLATLCEVTSHESFNHKIRDEYGGFASDKSKAIFETVCIVSSLRIDIPLVFLCEIHDVGASQLLRVLEEECSGKIHVRKTKASLRHFGIAEYIVKRFIDDGTKVQRIIDICRCVSRKFSIEDIRFHPLSYRIYKNALSYRYLTSNINGEDRFNSIESIYSSCQTFFSEDGIFWLQYGRFLEKFDRMDDAIHCLRKGLGLYDSFQIRHALGDVLLRAYIKNGGVDEDLYDEGIELLENELSTRGVDDSYVATTFVDRLLDIYEVLQRQECLEHARKILNHFMKIHESDPQFRSIIVRFTKVQASID